MTERDGLPGAPKGAPDRCPRCGAAFACGIAAGDCWCAALPPLPRLPAWPGAEGQAWPAADGQEAPAGCLCPDCLRALVAQAGLRTR